MSVSGSPPIGALPATEVIITVRNDAKKQLSWNPASWDFFKFDDQSWRWLAPLGTPQPLDTIEPGDSYQYTIEINTTSFEDVNVNAGAPTVRFHGLGPGVYGFVNDSGDFEDVTDPSVQVGALFGVAGQAPPLEPTDAIEQIEREGSELVVTGGSDDEQWELLVTFVESDDFELLPEQVRMVEALRNTVTFAPAEGIEAVRYVGDPVTVNTTHNYLSIWTPDDATSYGIGDYAFETKRITGPSDR